MSALGEIQGRMSARRLAEAYRKAFGRFGPAPTGAFGVVNAALDQHDAQDALRDAVVEAAAAVDWDYVISFLTLTGQDQERAELRAVRDALELLTKAKEEQT